jgi:hypothetical protein
MCSGEIRAQPLAGLQLFGLDQGPAVAAAPARQPSQRAFRLIDRHFGVAVFGRDLVLRQVEVLAAKTIDFGLRGFARAGG